MRLSLPGREQRKARADRRQLPNDGVDLAPVARPLPQERLRKLGAADPEETGYLGVELASGLPGRRTDVTLTAGCRHDRRVGGGELDPAGWRFGGLDPVHHVRIVAGEDQRGVFIA